MIGSEEKVGFRIELGETPIGGDLSPTEIK